MDGEEHEEHPRRLARILHDHISGQVALALRNVELFEFYQQDDPVRARRKVQTAQEVLQDLMATLGAVLLEVDGRGGGRPDGLREALLAVVEAFDPCATEVEVVVSGQESRLAPAVRAELLVVLREALLNALRHAAAARIRVEVRIGAEDVLAEVIDDGVGMPQEPAHGVGLRSMRYRVAGLGGAVSAGSRPGGRGSAVRVAVPLAVAAAVR